mgnify:CR=1 FL=1
MFKIDNIGPVDLTNLQNCLCCNKSCSTGATGPTGSYGPTGPVGDYTGTGFFGPGFPNSGTIIPDTMEVHRAISLLRQPTTYYPLQFGDNVNVAQIASESAIILANYNENSSNNGQNAIAIGNNAGQIDQDTKSISIGYNAGNSSQGANSIAIGVDSGLTAQGINAVAIGKNSGTSGQHMNAVAVGVFAGYLSQQANSVAIGNSSGQNTQGLNSVAIGYGAALNYQGQNCVAIGNGSGMTTQGNYSIAIGFSASTFGQPENCIAISADALGVDNPVANSCVIKPIRNVNGDAAKQMFYDSATGELTWGTISSSIRYKENIIPISDENIHRILELNPVEFDFKTSGKHSFGLIAEDVNTILPHVVKLNPESGIIEGVDYEQLVAPLIAIIKRQQEQISNLSSRIEIAGL